MIEKIGSNDLGKIIEIEKEAFNDYWEISVYEKLFVDYEYKAFIYREDEKVVAYAIFLDMVDVYELIKIAVKKEHRNQGIGYKFLSDSLNLLDKTVFLEVRENNFSAISLYKKIGFKEINIRKNYYKDTGENALIMSYEK